MASLEARLKKLEVLSAAKQASKNAYQTRDAYFSTLSTEEIMDSYYSKTRQPLTPEQQAEQDKWTENKTDREMINELLQRIKESYLE